MHYSLLNNFVTVSIAFLVVLFMISVVVNPTSGYLVGLKNETNFMNSVSKASYPSIVNPALQSETYKQPISSSYFADDGSHNIFLVPISAGSDNLKLKEAKKLSSTGESSTNGDAPFEFPMPLGEMGDRNKVSSDLNSSTFEATMIPNKTDTKRMNVNYNNASGKSGPSSPEKLKNPSSGDSNILTVHALAGRQHPHNIATYPLPHNGNIYQVEYNITSNNKLITLAIERDGITLQANLSSKAKGSLSMQLPRFMTNRHTSVTNPTREFIVFKDSQYAHFDQWTKSNNATYLTIDFDKGTKQIAVVPFHASPELNAPAVSGYAFSISILFAIIWLKYKARLGRL
jgi:hypothetical protein